MASWNTRYRPANLVENEKHLNENLFLSELVENGNVSHMLFHGPGGAGKKTRIMDFLREVHGSRLTETSRIQIISFEIPPKKPIDMTILTSDYHIEINPSLAGRYDKKVIMDFIKGAALRNKPDYLNQCESRAIIVRDADKLTKLAQQAIRVMMEEEFQTCKLILCAKSPWLILPAIRSRCLNVRVGTPTVDKIKDVLKKVSMRELPDKLAEKIAIKCNGNLRQAVLMYEATRIRQYPFSEYQEVADINWKAYLDNTAIMMLSLSKLKKVLEVRNRIHELVVHGTPPDVILRRLHRELYLNCEQRDRCSKIAFIHRLHQRMLTWEPKDNRVILDSFVAQVMSLPTSYDVVPDPEDEERYR